MKKQKKKKAKLESQSQNPLDRGGPAEAHGGPGEAQRIQKIVRK